MNKKWDMHYLVITNNCGWGRDEDLDIAIIRAFKHSYGSVTKLFVYAVTPDAYFNGMSTIGRIILDLGEIEIKESDAKSIDRGLLKASDMQEKAYELKENHYEVFEKRAAEKKAELKTAKKKKAS